MLPLTFDIARLRPQHRSAVRLHLLALSPDDRYARFGMVMQDVALLQWAATIDWQHQHWWGAWGTGDLCLLGVLQLTPTQQPGIWEPAMTVASQLRGQGVGTALVHTAVHAMPNLRGLACHHAHAAVQSIAQQLGWTLQSAGSEAGVQLLRD